MRTDRELLELAAKAVGIDAPYDEKWGGMLLPVTVRETDDGFQFWNPLTDDGDALRLAVKIKQLISINDENTFAAAQIENMPRLDRHGLQHIEHGKDPYAATRRAIVRAAATIGKHSAPSGGKEQA